MARHLAHTSLPLIARRMKAARELLGISQMELGVRAGIDEYSASARINQYERGKHSPDFSTIRSLGRALGVPTAYFYAEDDLLAELIVIFDRLSEQERKRLVEFAQAMQDIAKTKPKNQRVE